jgi:hypothetical protein
LSFATKSFMTRAWRIEYEGALYHVLYRGNDRRNIVVDDKDRNLFLDTAGEMSQRFEVDICAYVLMDKWPNEWQNAKYILSLFGVKTSVARRLYSEFVEKGIRGGKRPELVGGGLIPSPGGWVAPKQRVGVKIGLKETNVS